MSKDVVAFLYANQYKCKSALGLRVQKEQGEEECQSVRVSECHAKKSI